MRSPAASASLMPSGTSKIIEMPIARAARPLAARHPAARRSPGSSGSRCDRAQVTLGRAAVPRSADDRGDGGHLDERAGHGEVVTADQPALRAGADHLRPREVTGFAPADEVLDVVEEAA